MADAQPFHVRPAWPEAMVYEENEALARRELRFEVRHAGVPPTVVVPAPERWTALVPAWAADRRDLIVARLRAARCVVWEAGLDEARVESPDGALVIQLRTLRDERCGPWETIRILRGAETLAELLSFGLGASVRFTADPATLVIADLVDRRGQRVQVLIDTAARSYRLHPHDRPEPLAELAHVLAASPSAGAPFAVRRTPMRAALDRFGNAAGLVGSLVLAAGGLWMALAAQAMKDRLIGAFGLVFFGLCAACYRRRPTDDEPPR